ncbi:MAG: radical SAM protein [Bacteroidales bacterium]|nr:radical SAM protein [Bacteroidales bacterium]
MNVDENSKKVVFELITYCNLNCSYCIYRISNKLCSSNFVLEENAYNLIDKISKKEIYKLVLTGGEPTLHPDFIDISKYAISKIPKVSLCTNGVILNEDLENKVINLNFSSYTISIDSHINKIHDKLRGKKGALQKTLGFIKKLKSKNKNISLHIALNPQNVDTIEDTIKFCKSLAPEVVISSIYHYDKIYTNSNAIKNYRSMSKKFYEKYKNNPEVVLVGFKTFCINKNCLDQKNIFMINSKGKLITCYWKKDGGKIVKKY